MIKRTLRIDSDYIHIPLKQNMNKNELQFWLGGVLQFQFSLDLSDEGPYHYYFINVASHKNTEMDLVVPYPNGITEKSLAGIFSGHSPEQHEEYKDLYEEAIRPQFHFSSRRGWLNDPNGLFYHAGLYHLYYQHNPFGTSHGNVNISWGHAVSEDLVHWRERKDAIMPWRRDWLIASGSAIVDRKNTLGYGEDAIVAAYTCLGTQDEGGGEKYAPHGGQFLAVSTNGGEDFFRPSDKPIICDEGDAWRDPRIFEDRDKYYIAVFEDRGGIYGVSFYASENLRDWEFKSWSPDLVECPDIFPLKVVETGETKWVLYGGNGMAKIGSFDGGVFSFEGTSYPLDYGVSHYSSQTWSHAPGGRRVHINWMREWVMSGGSMSSEVYHNMPFSQCMSIPCEIALHKVDGRYHLCRFPVAEINNLRIKPAEKTEINIDGSHAIPLAAQSDVCLTVNEHTASLLKFELFGHSIDLMLDDAVLKVDEKPVRKLMRGISEIRILTDRASVEIFVGDEAAVSYMADTAGAQLSIKGEAHISKQEWKLSSIWQKYNTP